MTVQLGSSGARLIVRDEYVTKLDVGRTGTRVRDQGIWLSERGKIDYLPDVYVVRPDGYEMEHLDQYPLEALVGERQTYCELILDALEKIWSTGWSFDAFELHPDGMCWGRHGRYVTSLFRQTRLVQYRRRVRLMAWQINWSRLQGGTTHGDPILENLLFRGKTPVLIDPIPACSALPDVRASDVGRVIQSAVGYERIRYGLQPVIDPWDVKGPSYATTQVLNYWMDDGGFDLNEARAAVYFAIIHTARGVRSAPTEELKTELRVLVDWLVAEAERWME